MHGNRRRHSNGSVYATAHTTITGMAGGDDFTYGEAGDNSHWNAYLIASATGTYTPVWNGTVNQDFCGTTVAFKQATAGAGVPDLTLNIGEAIGGAATF